MVELLCAHLLNYGRVMIFSRLLMAEILFSRLDGRLMICSSTHGKIVMFSLIHSRVIMLSPTHGGLLCSYILTAKLTFLPAYI